MRVKTLVAWPTLILGLSLPTLMDCSAAKDAADLASGCDELNQGPTGVASLSIDAKLKAFVQATADLQVVAGEIKADVKTACVNMVMAFAFSVMPSARPRSLTTKSNISPRKAWARS